MYPFSNRKQLNRLPAGSEGDIAGSSSDGDDPNRVLPLEATGTCSPFGRRQFPRDSGCYDASLKSNRQAHHHVSPQGESDTSETTGFSDTTNNLDSIVEQCNNEILARVRQAQKNSLNLREDPIYQPNIPNSTSIDKLPPSSKAKDSYVSVHGQTTLVDPCRKLRRRNNADEDSRFHVVKYVVGGSDVSETGSSVILLGSKGACLSEKSSDSGVSSSSISSSNPRDARQAVLDGGGVLNFSNCANRTTSNTANDKSVERGIDKNAF